MFARPGYFYAVIVSLLLGLTAGAVRAADAAKAPKNILVLGDSLTAGYGLDPDEAYPALLQEKIEAAGLNYKVINAGLSGDTTAGGLRRVSWLLRQPVDVLLLELGGNDGLRGVAPEETRKNLLGIIEKVRAKYPQAQVVVAGMQMPNNVGEEYAKAYREIFPEVAKNTRSTLIPYLLEGVGGKAELNLPDRIHPTAEGHRIVANTVWKVLEPVLRKESDLKG